LLADDYPLSARLRLVLTRPRFDPLRLRCLMYDLLPLNCLAAGTAGEIAELVGRADLVQRLREMGLASGVRVEIVQSGSPCIIRVNGHRLCFRDCESMGVLVRTVAAA
jgi:ferrous iron transport protein A